MNWQPVDCHAHSTFSDGALTIDQVVQRAVALGVMPSVADHISRDVARTVDSIDGIRAYLDELDRHPVLRGGEFCYHDALWRELPDDLVRRFTHRVGSIHAVRFPDGSIVRAFARRSPKGLTVDKYMNAHLDYLEAFAREMPVDLLAHPTLVHLPFRGEDVDVLWNEERETRLVNALFAGGIASRFRIATGRTSVSSAGLSSAAFASPSVRTATPSSRSRTWPGRSHWRGPLGSPTKISTIHDATVQRPDGARDQLSRALCRSDRVAANSRRCGHGGR